MDASDEAGRGSLQASGELLRPAAPGRALRLIACRMQAHSSHDRARAVPTGSRANIQAGFGSGQCCEASSRGCSRPTTRGATFIDRCYGQDNRLVNVRLSHCPAPEASSASHLPDGVPSLPAHSAARGQFGPVDGASHMNHDPAAGHARSAVALFVRVSLSERGAALKDSAIALCGPRDEGLSF
jgi:hypothetical protein